MADPITDFTTIDFMSVAANAGSTGYDIVLWVLIALVVGGIIGFILYVTMFNRKVRVHYRTRNGSYVMDDKARLKRKDGVEYWSFLKLKRDVTPPPTHALYITKGGKFVAECLVTEDNPEPVWLSYDTEAKPNELTIVTSQERESIVNRYIKAASRKKKSLWENISQIIMPIAVITIVMIPFIFWGDITKTTDDALATAEQLSKQNAEVAAQNARILSVLAGKIESGELNINQEIPPDANTVGGGGD